MGVEFCAVGGLRGACAERKHRVRRQARCNARMSYHELLVQWSRADVTATAYALIHGRSQRLERVFLAEQLRGAADTWRKALELEVRHMQQRMPRV